MNRRERVESKHDEQIMCMRSELGAGDLALPKERVRRERLAVVVLPGRQVRVRVCLDVRIDVILRREVIGIAANVDRIRFLVDLRGKRASHKLSLYHPRQTEKGEIP